MAVTLYSFTRVVRELTVRTPKLISLALSLSVTFSVHFSSFCVRWTNEVLFTYLISGSFVVAKTCCYPALPESHIYIYIYIYKTRNDCRGFDNLSYTVHLRQEYMYFFYLIEQHSKFLLHTLQVLYMCTLCDSTNINTIIEFIPHKTPPHCRSPPSQ